MPRRLAALVALSASSLPSVFGQVHFEILAHTPGLWITPQAVSYNGQIVVGYSSWLGTAPVPFRWNEAEGFRHLEIVYDAVSSSVTGLSADGLVAVGIASYGHSQYHDQRALRWTPDAGLVELPDLSTNRRSRAFAVSGDGSTIVGESEDGHGVARAVRWDAAGVVQTISTLAQPTSATGVSSSGAVIVGEIRYPTSGIVRAFLWTAAQGMVQIGAATSGVMEPVDVSESGSRVLLRLTRTGQDRLYLWTLGGGTQLLASAASTRATFDFAKLNGDGTAAVWRDYDPTPNIVHAGYWSASTGVLEIPGHVDLRDVDSTGDLVVGSMLDGPFTRAMSWSPAGGFEFFDNELPTHAVAIMTTPDGTQAVGYSFGRRLSRWRLSGEVGGGYCGPTIPNSTGAPAGLVALGTNVPASGDLRLEATSLPAHATCLILASRTPANVPPGATGQGRLCLGGAIGRFLQPGQIQNSGASGQFDFIVPTNELPSPTGPVSGVPGDTWHFQAWFRDSNPTPTSNFTPGVRVTLQ